MKKKFLPPMLAKVAEKPFDREGWLFEIKWDGFRALAYKNRDVQLLSRNEKSLTARFSEIASDLKKLPGSFVLDGEIVVLDEKGISRFQLLQNIQRKKTAPPLYYVFDILWLNEKELRELPFFKRREILVKLLKKKKLTYVRLSEAIEEKGVSFFRAAKKLGLEGIMAKRKESLYRSSRSSDWLKIKTGFRQEVVIGGFTAPKGSRKLFGALLIGVYKKGKLSYVGHVGGGFNAQLLQDVYAKLKRLVTTKCPFVSPPHPNAPVTWVKPQLVCEVAFAEWTADGKMRQPIFKGLRSDKDPKQVVRE